MSMSRRTFLTASTTSLASLGLSGASSSFLTGQERTSGMKLGLIGCKSMGWGDLKSILNASDAQCVALCDVDQRQLDRRAKDLKDKTGNEAETYTDFRKLIDRDDLDAVVIGTPDHWHCLPMVRACQANKHVYVEKPLANSIAECRVMRKAARNSDSIVQVGQQQRSAPHWQNAIEFVHSGKLGEIRRVKVWANFNYGAGPEPEPDQEPPDGVDYDMWLGPAPKRPFNPNRFHGWWRVFWDYGGGLLTDYGAHLLDMAIWGMKLDGPPNSVVAHGGIFAHEDHAIETPDTLSVLYEFDDFTLTWENNAGIQTGPWGRHYGVAFIGTNGTLIADRENWEVKPESADGDKKRMKRIPPKKSRGSSHMFHARDFVQSIKQRKKPTADIDVGYQSALYAHLGNIAYRTGDRIVWDEDENKIPDDPEANELIRPPYRDPWTFPDL